MRANRRGRSVYTERGYGARDNKPRVPMMVAETPEIQRPARDSALPVPLEKLCPHGGQIIDDVPRCGLCFQQKADGTPEESFDLFVLGLYALCERIAKKHWQWSGAILLKDRWHHMIVTLLEPRNLWKLSRARKPEALAYSIAERRLIDLQRSPVYWKEWNVSQLAFGSDVTSKDRASNNEYRLETISAGTQLRQEWDESCYERVRVFPGVNLLWTDENLQRLRVVLCEAESKLPKYPYDVSLAIKLSIGYYPETGKYTFDEVAEWASEQNGKTITPRQARYAIEQGLEAMKSHLLKSLVPDLKGVTK